MNNERLSETMRVHTAQGKTTETFRKRETQNMMEKTHKQIKFLRDTRKESAVKLREKRIKKA